MYQICRICTATLRSRELESEGARLYGRQHRDGSLLGESMKENSALCVVVLGVAVSAAYIGAFGNAAQPNHLRLPPRPPPPIRPARPPMPPPPIRFIICSIAAGSMPPGMPPPPPICDMSAPTASSISRAHGR